MTHAYDPKTPRFWDPADLRKSIDKVLDVCNGCRLCHSLCGSFPAIFDAAEAHADDTSRFKAHEIDRVVDECFQCKVCYERCPYTPDQGHAYDLDFPRLMQRALAQRVRANGLPLRDRVLGNPDAVASVATGLAAPIANWANERSLHRALLARFAGISPKKRLPRFAASTFRRWFRRRRRADGAPARGRITYFATCFVDYSAPHIGKAATSVLEHHGFDVAPCTGVCCGMPKWANGDVEGATQHAAENVRRLAGRARAGETIVVTNPTCSLQIREEYPRLLGTDDARVVAERTRDLGEWLRELDKAGTLRTDFKAPLGKIAYHVPCHLRAQKIGTPIPAVLAKAGAEVETVRACSGHDGTWSMKSEHFDASMRYGQGCFTGMTDAGVKQCASDCPLAAIQIEQATGLKVEHPIELMARAYGLAEARP